MRIGEVLVRSGMLSVEQVEQVLRAQVMWGGRFGTNAIELGFVDLDLLARAIGRQHQLPPAFLRHFQAADRDLQALLSPELAAEYAVIPLRRVGTERVAIASLAPLDGKARALVADQLGISFRGLIPAVAAELRIRWQLEHVYGIPRDVRFLRARKKSTVPSFDITITETDDDVDFAFPREVHDDNAQHVFDAVPEEQLPELTPRVDLAHDDDNDRRHYIRMLDEAQPLARIEIKRHAIGTIGLPPLGKPVATLADATRAIRRAPDREQVGRLVLDTIARFAGAAAAALFVVRGEAATGWLGYGPAGELPQLAVPLDQPNTVAAALRTHKMLCSNGDLGPIDRLLLKTLDVPRGELIVAPIVLGAHVWSLIVLASEREVSLEPVEAITAAAASAFARLLRYANR